MRPLLELTLPVRPLPVRPLLELTLPVRPLLGLTGGLTSHSAHVLAASDGDHHEAAAGEQSDRLSHWKSLPCLWKLAQSGINIPRRGKVESCILLAARSGLGSSSSAEVPRSAEQIAIQGLRETLLKGLIDHAGCKIRRIGVRRITGLIAKVRRYCSSTPFSVDYHPSLDWLAAGVAA